MYLYLTWKCSHAAHTNGEPGSHGRHPLRLSGDIPPYSPPSTRDSPRLRFLDQEAPSALPEELLEHPRPGRHPPLHLLRRLQRLPVAVGHQQAWLAARGARLVPRLWVHQLLAGGVQLRRRRHGLLRLGEGERQIDIIYQFSALNDIIHLSASFAFRISKPWMTRNWKTHSCNIETCQVLSHYKSKTVRHMSWVQIIF